MKCGWCKMTIPKEYESLECCSTCWQPVRDDMSAYEFMNLLRVTRGLLPFSFCRGNNNDNNKKPD